MARTRSTATLKAAPKEEMPSRLEPMLAKPGRIPESDGDDWAYEIKWDGVRAIGYVDGGRLRLEARSGRDITPRYPELRELGRALAGHDAIVDGEVVAELGPGAIFGERAVLEGGLRTSTLRAMTKCRVAVARKDQLDVSALAEISEDHHRESQADR